MKRSHYKSYFAAGVTAFCVIAAAILLFFLLFHASVVRGFLTMLARILRPIFLGMIIAFLLLPIHRGILRFMMAMTPNSRLENPRDVAFLNILAIIFSLFFAFFLLYLLMAMVIPQVYLSVVGLVQAFPGYIESVQTWLLAFLENNPEIQSAVMPLYNSAAASLEQWLVSDILPNLESVTSTIKWIKESILPNITGVVSNVSAVIIAFLLLMKDLLIALIVSVYLLARKDTFAAQSKKIVYSLFPTRVGDLLVDETRNAYRILSGFINGKLLDSLIIGVITLVCCNLLKFPYPALLATIIGVTNIIPFFGPFIGAVPCAFLILLVSPIQCVYFVIFIIVLQQFDGNILGPKILGDSTGLASFWVLFSILLFGGLFGFMGMVLGVPVFAMLYSIITRLVRRGLRNHGLPVETEYYLGKTSALAQASRDGAGEKSD
ncbi:MAG: AI-2E family transporter [Lawsonibacter sp.]|nr:AI-2E family transporter [Lawsonibacter sp.]